ncbi:MULTISPECIES: DNA polymerase III subunit delta [unclassified Meiothermus]|uniref:DNA polymerase III subunit delta n=1 Tax=unclassified Meiothermus TaxID=370471 RepID=UPI000D7C9272|nr:MULTISPECIES: DNA polymerase III subunit delta [unclassified Meiothermus]PZA06616.1 DNA polymerase III subunit delta [Meiothermus sp. Pnk-1]RYM37720.1 DNA polymerase III subunit delta [Meiothermus sp. PNK-Is4]
MLLAFTGDPLLAREALLQEARVRGLSPRLLPPEPALVAQEASGGLFGPSGALVDLREIGEGEWKLLKEALEPLPEMAIVLLLDPKPTAARSKWYGKERIREHPTPQGKDLVRWIENRAKAMGLKTNAAIHQYLASLLGGRSTAENPALGLEALQRELDKLTLVTPPVTLEKVQALVALEAPLSGFDLVRAVTEGKTSTAFRQLRGLMERGEDPIRILGALSWQYAKLAQAWAQLYENPLLGEREAAGLLGMHPYAAKQTLALAKTVNPEVLDQALEILVKAEQAAKTGRDSRLALEKAVAELSAQVRRLRPYGSSPP